mmetsp:Transcript_25520/g.55198  ORF Transcript_25520/g.55198 Transcript_25520/m.55198 type:complete len:320 (-) Transcript_25520:58-1017(-)
MHSRCSHLWNPAGNIIEGKRTYELSFYSCSFNFHIRFFIPACPSSREEVPYSTNKHSSKARYRSRRRLLLLLRGSPAGRPSLGDLGPPRLLLLSDALVDKSSVNGGVGLRFLQVFLRVHLTRLLAADHNRCYQALDFGTLGDGLALLLESAGDHELLDIVLLRQVEQLTDLASSLGAKSLGDRDIGDALDLAVALLGDHQVQHSKIRGDDAPTHRLPLPLSDSAGSVARGASLEQKSNTGVGQHTLLHGEALLVVSTRNSEDVTSELGAQILAGNLLGDSLLVDSAQLLLIIDLDELLVSRCGVCDVDLHGSSQRRVEE